MKRTIFRNQLLPWLLLPGLAIVIIVLSFNFLGDGLREFADAVRESAAEREEVLRAAVSGEIDGRGVADLLENPASEVDDR